MQLAFSNQLGYVQQLHMTQPEIAKKLSLSHVVNSLTFGDIAMQLAIRKRFGYNEHTSFDMMDFVDDALYANDSEVKDYLYFYKLVPHIFVDKIHLEEYESYSYSLNHNSKVSTVVRDCNCR